MAKSKKSGVRSKARRFGSRIKHRAKAAKPSIAIIGGLSAPLVVALTEGGLPQNSNDLMIRLKKQYLNADNNGTTYGLGSMIKSNAVKAGVAGFAIHWFANITGANRYLARMKFPFRI